MNLKGNRIFFAGVATGVCATIAVFCVAQMWAPIWSTNVKVAVVITGIAMLLVARLFRSSDSGGQPSSEPARVRSPKNRRAEAALVLRARIPEQLLQHPMD
jgi:hypothetical protein